MIDDPAVPMSYDPDASEGGDPLTPEKAESESMPIEDAQDTSLDQPESLQTSESFVADEDSPGIELDPEPEAEASPEDQKPATEEQEPDPVAVSASDGPDLHSSEPDAEPPSNPQDEQSAEPDLDTEPPPAPEDQDAPVTESMPDPEEEPAPEPQAVPGDEVDPEVAIAQESGAGTAVKAGQSASAGANPASAAQSSAAAPPPAEPAVMPLMEHLIELRGRLIWAALALLITTGISFIFAKQVLVILIAPMGDAMPQALKPTESLGNYMKVALICGVTLAMPMIVYQIGAFLAPGLTKQEKRWLFLLVPGATFCFLVGVAFAYFVMLPTAIPFLQGFMSDIIEQGWAIGEYLSFVTSLLFWIGLAFELPLFVFFLAKLGIVNSEMLSRNRKYAYLGIAVVAAVITPTVDPLNMMLVMAPLVVLYELGVILAKIA